MLGMSEYQLDLMFEYIKLTSSSSNQYRLGQIDEYNTSMSRLSEIKNTLLNDARANEEKMSKISASIDKMRADTITFGQR